MFFQPKQYFFLSQQISRNSVSACFFSEVKWVIYLCGLSFYYEAKITNQHCGCPTALISRSTHMRATFPLATVKKGLIL